MFEMGYAIGLGLPVIPIRDRSYKVHEREFMQLGLIDTIGYLAFTNAEELAKQVTENHGNASPVFAEFPINDEMPLFVVKSPVSSLPQVPFQSRQNGTSCTTHRR
jgi:hypothetical protein